MLANKLNYGDTIGVVGVSNSLEIGAGYDCFYKAEKLFQSKGFKIKRGKYVLEDYYYSAGTREQRAEDMMNMFKDDEVKAIICLKGGETCNTFIDLLDYDVIKKNPKIITGYSDITVLLETIYKKTGIVTFHGPDFIDFGKDYAEEDYKEFENAFINKKIEKFNIGKKKFVRCGKAEGKIIGTNLGSMMHLLGTEYLPDMQDKILAIESYRTSPNECQRRLAHLKQFGMFDKIKGVVIGYNYDLQKNGDRYPQMEDILLEYTKEYDFPIVKCNDFGHRIANSVIPIGVNVKIDSDSNKVEVLDEFLV
ncbi:MAG: LD-carboxypeptidase [Bacilli bacterium]|nr:LD-carboxypeptidase [Bacilli bacterium]